MKAKREILYRRLAKLEDRITEKETFISSPMPYYYTLFCSESDFLNDLQAAENKLANLKKKVNNILKELAYESN